MKRAIFMAFAVGVICGCKPASSDDFKALSKKIDNFQQMQALSFSNQFLIAAFLEHLSTNLPNVRQVSDLDYYYYTNTAEKLNSINEGTLLILNQNSWLTKMASLEMTNTLNANGELKADAIESETLKIQEMLSGLNFRITNGTTEDIIYTRLKVDDMSHDIDRIKFKLGIE